MYCIYYVIQLISRRLKQAGGFTGAEGAKDDDWIVVSQLLAHSKAVYYLTHCIPFLQSQVDCSNLVVQLLLADTRLAIDLEGHWTAEERPTYKLDYKTGKINLYCNCLLYLPILYYTHSYT